MKNIISCLIVALLLVGCGKTDTSSNAVVDNAEAFEKIAIQFVNDFSGDQKESIFKNYAYDQQMKNAMNDELYTSIQDLLQNFGSFQSRLEVSAVSQNPFIIVTVPVKFEKVTMAFVVVFNGEKEIAGFQLTPYETEEDEKEQKLPEGTKEVELSITMRDEKEIHGSMISIDSDKNAPVVVMVHGSGANDRDETLYSNHPFKDIAYALAEKGIGTYRYDKRTYTYGGDAFRGVDYTVEEEVIFDVVDIVNFFQQENPEREIYLLGHSLGGYLMPRIAKEVNVDGFIMMAAPVSNMRDLMAYQFDYLSQFSNEEEKKIYNGYLEELGKLDRLDLLKEDELVVGAYPSYWKDILSYDPIEEAASMTEKVLVLQGEEDYQVPYDEFLKWKDAYGDSMNWTFRSFDKLSHLFMEGSLEENPNSYYLTPSVVDARVTDAIAAFIQGE